MRDDRLERWRAAVRAGQVPAALVEELRRVAGDLARRRALPPSFAPYGQWDQEAAEEVFASWYADRLLGAGQLQALLDRAASLEGLGALAGRSMRQHLLNRADRSQSRNLFTRVVATLRDSALFVEVRAAARAGDTWFALAPPRGRGLEARLWADGDRLLRAHAWAIGDLVVIRYKAAASKLSPVLDRGELERFIVELATRAEAALTADLLMRALAARLDLGPTSTLDLEEVPAPVSAEPTIDQRLAIEETGRAVLASLTPRQRVILARVDDPVAELAESLGCAVGTVVNERRRIGVAITRLTEGDEERDAVLNAVADLLYAVDDD